MVRIIAVLLVALLVGAGGYWSYITSPEYSLMQMSAAIKQRDVDNFGRYFDIHSVAVCAVDDLMAAPVRRIGETGLIERLLGAAAVGWLQPAVVAKTEDSIMNFVRNYGVAADRPVPTGVIGSIVNVLRPPALSDVLRGLGFSSATYRGTDKVQRADKLAHTNLLFERSPGINTKVEMELKQQTDSSWRIVRFSNLQKVSQEVQSDGNEE